MLAAAAAAAAAVLLAAAAGGPAAAGVPQQPQQQPQQQQPLSTTRFTKAANPAGGPAQVHLALTGKAGELRVMWADGAAHKAAQPSILVCRGASGDEVATQNSKTQCELVAADESQSYFDPLPTPYQSPEFRAGTVAGLQPAGAPWWYRVGDAAVPPPPSSDPLAATAAWSPMFASLAPRAPGSTGPGPLRFSVVGDHGVAPESHRIAQALALEVNASVPGARMFEMQVHPGDISYANGIQKYWDEWANMVQPFASHTPWMVAPGNHEAISLFVPYEHRFSMPAKNSGSKWGNMYYSWDIGQLHIIALNSENVEFWHHGDPMGQYQWLKDDLAKVDRKVTPWIAAFWHTPWYCSNHDHSGSGDDMRDSYEDLFFEQGVNLVFTGHVHAYQRNSAIYKGKVNPAGPTYFVVGTGGNNEGLKNGWDNPEPAWSRFTDGTRYGYGAMTIHNATHASWEYVLADGKVLTNVLDSADIVNPHAK